MAINEPRGRLRATPPMATAIRTIGHEDRLSLVEHLDELRTRIIVSLLALAVAFGFCLWQNHALLHVINHPLDKQTQKQVAKGNGPLGQTALAQQGVLKVAGDTELIIRALSARGSGLSAATRAQLAGELPRLRADTARIPKVPEGNKPVTLGIGEPFTTTLTVSLFFALILSLPIILFQLYGFILPALSPNERRIALPLVTAIPFLFVVGVVFGYFVVLPAAVRFFQNFNSGEFNVLVQANQYYKFAATVLLAMGLVFQVPVAILACTRVGIVTPAQLRKHRRYAIVACAAVAAFLPGDAITLLLETVPLYVLYEASILLASLVARRDAARTRAEESARQAQGPPGNPPPSGAPAGTAGSPEPPSSPPSPAPDAPPDDPPGPPARDSQETEPTVQQIIDHIDRELSD
jgi:sec-independent protein translocase protein TatC